MEQTNQANNQLIEAVIKGNVDVIRFLIEHGGLAELNSQIHVGMTPLLIAIEQNHLDLVKFLIEKYGEQLDFQKQNNKGENALLLAIKHNLLNIAQQIMQLHIQQTTLKAMDELQLSTGSQICSSDTDTLWKLVDLYLSESILGTWTIKDGKKIVAFHTNRDKALGKEDEHTKKFWQQHDKRLQFIREAINIFAPAFKKLSDKELKEKYKETVQEKGRYFRADLSDDSDSEDEEAFIRGDDNRRVNKYLAIKECVSFNEEFWQKTRRTTVQKVGLGDELQEYKNKKELPNKEIIEKLQDKLTSSGHSQTRGCIKKSGQQFPKKFIAQFRGINYMEDRWSKKARRYHYYMDEIGQPQFSEAVLKELPFDFYTELDYKHDFYRNAKFKQLLLQLAEQVKKTHQQLFLSDPVIRDTVKPTKKPYLFNSEGDYLQHGFSNGINLHLLKLKELRESDNNWKKQLLNAFNYGVATGDRPYHSLKYLIGLKEYYVNSFKIDYNKDGKIQNSHAGKIYIILHEVEQFNNESSLNRVVQMTYDGRTPIARDIVPELETNYIGGIPAERIVYQLSIKFPSFHRKKYKEIYEIKYGMDKNLYESFQFLIQNTNPESELRQTVIDLLKEWLCAYYEVLLLKTAQQEAQKREGELVYVNAFMEVANIPDKGPFTQSDENLPIRNQVHVLQEIRWHLGSLLKNSSLNEQEVNIYIENLLSNDIPQSIIKKIVFPKFSGIQTKITNRELSQKKAQSQEAKIIIQGKRQTFFKRKKEIVGQDLSLINLANPEHLYTDDEINALLQQYNPNINVYAAQHPLIRGNRHEQNARALFAAAIRSSLQQTTTTLIPINTTRERIPSSGQIPMAGTHWVGVVIRWSQNDGYSIEYIDPLNNENDARDIEQLIKSVAGEMKLKINYQIISTNQQGTDLDCGAWTVDNLRRRAQQQNLQTNQQVTGLALRQTHQNDYQTIVLANQQQANQAQQQATTVSTNEPS